MGYLRLPVCPTLGIFASLLCPTSALVTVVERIAYPLETIGDICVSNSLCSVQRLNFNVELLLRVIHNNVTGDIVEAGCYQGGSALSLILGLEHASVMDRHVHLYDTFEGMTEPTPLDAHNGIPAATMLGDPIVKAAASLDTVKRTLFSRSVYPKENIHFHVGDIVQPTSSVPEAIALLRLDTDWYERTRWELENFYPRVSRGGIVIVDDYGFWDGSRRAVDEFLAARQDEGILLQPIDGITALYWVKR